MTKLSVIVVTKNEAHNIKECLESVLFADEIIVFDSGSTDGTPEICRQFTDKVVITDWPGDGPQKNRAIDIAKGEWVLCLDADERVSTLLASEIQSILNNNPSHEAYDIPYQSTYCGKPIRFGDWRGESHVRLFLRAKARFTEDIVHCHLKVNGKTGKLKNLIIHHPFHHLGTMLHKMNDYTTQSAKILFDKGKKSSMLKALSRSTWSFFRSYLLKCGFLDGREGFLLAVSNAQGTYYRYVKLMYLCQAQKLGER